MTAYAIGCSNAECRMPNAECRMPNADDVRHGLAEAIKGAWEQLFLAAECRIQAGSAVALVSRLYDQFGFETVDNSPLSESWRTASGQPAWKHHDHQKRAEPARNLRNARLVAHARP